MLDNHKEIRVPQMRAGEGKEVQLQRSHTTLTPTLPVTVANQIHSNLTLGPGFQDWNRFTSRWFRFQIVLHRRDACISTSINTGSSGTFWRAWRRGPG